MKLAYLVVVDVQDDWSDKDYFSDGGEGRKRVVLDSFKRSIMSNMIRPISENGVVINSIRVADPLEID